MNSVRQIVREGIDFFYQLFIHRYLIFNLSLRDFQKKYIKNNLGLTWAILDPVAFVVIMYFVFGPRYGDKGANAIPFYVYLVTGYIAYELFNNSVMSICTTIKEHSFLLNKVSFRSAILPIVTLVSNLMVHLVVLGICFFVLIINKIYPSWYWVQLIYYIFALAVFVIAVGWLTSSIYLFFPDVRNILSIITRILFFVTPIFWKMEGLPPVNQFILKFNPVYYIVNGYRECLLTHTWFWERPVITGYFWLVCLTFLVIGVAVFKKLRPHFADVVA